MSGEVQVKVGADLKELQQKLAEASKMVDKFAQGMGKARGAAGQFAGAISQIGGASSAAAGLAGNLLSGFAVGGPLGLAVAGVNLLVGAIKETGKAEEEAAKKAAEAHSKRREQYAETAASLAKLRFMEAGGSGAVWDAHQANEVARVGQMQAQDEADKAVESLDAAIARIPAAASMKAAGKSLDEITRYYPTLRDAVDRVTEAQRRLAEAIQNTKNVEETGAINVKKAVAAQEDEAKAKADAAEQKATAAATADTRLQGNGAYDLQAKVPEATAVKGTDAGAYNAPQFDGVFAGSQGAGSSGILAKFKVEAEEAEAATRSLQAQVQELAGVAYPISDAFGSAFADMASGAKSAGAVFKDVTSQMLQMILDLVTKSVMAKALDAGAGAAASQSGIPVVGPILAVAAMSAMIGTVRGLLGQLPSAEGGWDIPKGINPIAQLHSGEMVLPQEQADAVRNMAGGKGGGGLTINLTTPDADSFYRMLKNRDSELFRVLNEGMRDRRFG